MATNKRPGGFFLDKKYSEKATAEKYVKQNSRKGALGGHYTFKIVPVTVTVYEVWAKRGEGK